MLRRFPSEVIEQVVTALKEQSLIDDAKFAHQWRDYRDRIKPRSASAIKRELVQKGVARDTAETAVTDMDDYDSAYRSAAKPAMRLNDADFVTFRRRLWGHLERRGYSYAVTRRTVDQLWDEIQESRVESPGDAEAC